MCLPGPVKMTFNLTTFLVTLFCAVTANHLLLMKSYEPAVISLDTPCVVKFKFINVGSKSLRIESFFDYTFYQSFFNAEKAIIPRFEEDQSLLLEPYHRSSLSLTPFCRNSNQELVFEIFPGKTGTFQDLPAKAVYSTVNQQDSDEEAITSQICWSTAHGKVEIHESAPLNSFGQKEIEGMSCDCRWALFLGVSGLNMAVPALNYRRLRRSLPPTRSRQ